MGTSGWDVQPTRSQEKGEEPQQYASAAMPEAVSENASHASCAVVTLADQSASGTACSELKDTLDRQAADDRSPDAPDSIAASDGSPSTIDALKRPDRGEALGAGVPVGEGDRETVEDAEASGSATCSCPALDAAAVGVADCEEKGRGVLLIDRVVDGVGLLDRVDVVDGKGDADGTGS